MYKFIGIDMDGTLLDSSHKVSDENIKAIGKAQNKGVNVVITTGRPYSGVKSHLKMLNMTSDKDYVIMYNGALIIRASDKSVIAESIIPLSDVLDLEKVATELGVKMHVVTEDACISSTENEFGRYEAVLNSMDYVVQDLSTLNAQTKIYKVMFSENEKVLLPLFNKMPEALSSQYELTMSAPFYIDILNKGVNKSYGVKVLREYLSIRQEETVCIGDSGNDISMISYAGLGVAMGNGTLELRRMADFVTLKNDEHGVAHVIDKFIVK